MSASAASSNNWYQSQSLALIIWIKFREIHVCMSYLIAKHVLVLLLLFMFMHDELKNIRIIELELFERTRCAIHRRLRRDESHYVQSK